MSFSATIFTVQNYSQTLGFTYSFFFQSLNKVYWLHPLPAHIYKIKCKQSNLSQFSFSIHVAITNWLWSPTLFTPFAYKENGICVTTWGYSSCLPEDQGAWPSYTLGSSGLPQALAKYHHRFRILKRPSRNFFIHRGLSTRPSEQWAT